jgi:hypothetical protein
MTRSVRIRTTMFATVCLSVGLFAPAAGALRASEPTLASRIVAPAASIPRGARDLGAVAASTRLTFGVFLNTRDSAGLARYASSVSDVHSPNYGRYLTRGQFAARFGASPASVATVAASLRARGLRVSVRALDGLQLTVSGSASTVERAFATHIDTFRLAGGAVSTGATSELRLPSAVAASVSGVVGLSDLARVHSSTRPLLLTHFRKPTNTSLGRHFAGAASVPGGPSACSRARSATVGGLGGITDDQVAHAYGLDGLYSAGDFGAGQTVAVYELEPFALSDVAGFENCYFGHSNTANITTINVDGGPGSGIGSGESALDIDNVAALSPAAHIAVYQAPNTTFGALDAYGQIVADDTAKVVTSSWGLCEPVLASFSPASLSVEHTLFEQAAAQGQTVFSASGDNGSTDCSTGSNPFGPNPTSQAPNINDPSGQPYVVSVGGTTAASVSDPPTEQVWNDGLFGGAGGGGPSSLWAEPAWQQSMPAVGSSAVKHKCGASGTAQCRVTPDVSAFADEYTGITYFIDGDMYTIGGTSSAAPLWAAMLAEVNASSTCQASITTLHGVGFASPLLYEIGASVPQYAASFNDVKTGNNDIFNDLNGQFSAKVGYDAASGLGSPNLFGSSNNGLAYNLCHDAQESLTSSVMSVSPSSGPVAGGTVVTINGSGFKTGSTVNVTAVNFGEQPAASFTVLSSNKITATTPPAGVTHAITNQVVTGAENLVSVTLHNEHAAFGPTFTYKYTKTGTQYPTISQVGPSGGPVAGGNTVMVYGTGFTGASSVTFGGVTASFVVKGPGLIQAVVPPEGAATCLAASHTTASGLCQTEVVVTVGGKKSPTVTSLKPFVGNVNYNNAGIPVVPVGCGCEVFPSLTEFDYQAAPVITSVKNLDASTSVPYISSDGFSEIAFSGHGFNILTFEWAAFGDPTQAGNQNPFPDRFTATSVDVAAPPDPNPSPSGDNAPVEVLSLGGPTGVGHVRYGPVPKLTSVSSKFVPTAGGLSLTLSGSGFAKVVDISFSPVYSGVPIEVRSNYTVVNSTTITMPSPSIVPGGYVIVVSALYGSTASYLSEAAFGVPSPSYADVPITNDEVVSNYPGDPVITGGSGPISCPVAGGCSMTLVGSNLGYPTTPTVLVSGQAAAVTNFTEVASVDTLTITIPPSLLGTPSLSPVQVVTAAGISPVIFEGAVLYR